MGHQVNFYAMPGEIAQMQQRICGIGPIRILDWRSATSQPRVLPGLGFEENGVRLLSYCLVRESDLSQVVTHHVPTQGYWTVEVLPSPVVEFDGCYFDGKILRRGRVYYVDGFYTENGEWVEKPEGFRAWAKAVLKAAKKGLNRRDSDYIGSEASEWLAQGDGHLEFL